MQLSQKEAIWQLLTTWAELPQEQKDKYLESSARSLTISNAHVCSIVSPLPGKFTTPEEPVLPPRTEDRCS